MSQFQAINSLELAMDAVTHIQKRFYEDFPPHQSESRYMFATPSTMKPTQIKASGFTRMFIVLHSYIMENLTN